MTLTSGDRIRSYEVVALLDGGGQGEVYRARDIRLSRDVALKVLRDDRLDDHARARFEREARALAALNHPNIATLHGIEAWRDVHVLVMELIEGESLATLLERAGPAGLPIDEALRIARQVALALEAAHERGIVHRDLKPGNVMIRPDGTVKVLDFGLAKTFTDDRGVATTVTSTGTGAAGIVGTARYMSPEQARGAEVDRRTDVWAFGCVLYEMLTGRRAFDGATASDAIAGVLGREPDFEVLPAQVDGSVRRLLRRCLQKDVRKRLRDMADARLEIDEALAAPTATAEASRTLSAPAQGHRRSAASLVMASVAALAVVAAFLAGNALRRPDGNSEPSAPIRLSTMLPPGVSVTRGPSHTSSVAVSPDGRTIVIAASDKDGQRLYRRPLDRLDPAPIAGTEGGLCPFFSWDGRWIGFFAYGRLKRIPAAGGAPVDVAAAPGFPSGASWGPDDHIVFAYGSESRLHVVPAEGGLAEPLSEDAYGRQPEVLPDGRTVLFEYGGGIHVYDRRTGAIAKLLAGTAPRYSNGHLIFSRGTTLLAAPFDMEDGVVGAPIAVTERVAVELPGSGGGRHYAISRNGVLVYVPAPDAYELVLVGADGEERVVGQPQRSLENPRFSPDGRSVVVAARRSDDEAADLWLHDLRTGTASRLTSRGGRAPVWIDSGTISYSHLGEQQGIYTTRVTGGAGSTWLLPLETFHWLVGWTPDRSTLLYGLMLKGVQSSSIMAHRDAQSWTVVGPGNTWGGRLSRDGKWLAYYALESGRFEVYVTPFPEGRTQWLIAEGTDPSWAADGNDIYYRSGPRLMAARLDKTTGVKVVKSRIVVDPFLPPLYDDYDGHPDGRTLVVVRPLNRTQGREVTTVVGWLDEFRTTGH